MAIFFFCFSVYIEQDGPTLVRLFFRRLSIEDAGNYSCEATLGTRMLREQTTLELIGECVLAGMSHMRTMFYLMLINGLQ